MANVWAIANGNWSAGGTWNTGAAPQAGDTVYANGFTITVNQNVSVAILTNAANVGLGVVAQGIFNVDIGIGLIRNITANILTGIGTAVNFTGSGTVNFVGNVTAGTINGIGMGGAMTPGVGTFNMIGNGIATGNTAIRFTTGIINCTGNYTGGTAAGAAGIDTGGSAVITINGNVLGGILGVGAANLSNGTMIVNGFAIPSNTVQAILGSLNTSVTVVQAAEYSSQGLQPTLGYVKFKNSGATIKITRQNNTTVVLTDPTEIAGQVPSPGDVRNGVNYLNGGLTGTLKVPAPQSVGYNVLTDNTVGQAVFNLTDFLAALAASSDPVATRLKNVATPEVVAAELQSALNT